VIRWIFGALLALVLLLLFVGYSPIDFRFKTRTPRAVAGDEPHYLLVANSLLFDHDLDLRADYARVRSGGDDAGRRFRGWALDHHTILVDPSTGAHAGWWTVYDWTRVLPSHRFARTSEAFPDSSAYLERSDHPAGYPLLVAGLLWPFPLDRSGVETAQAILNALAAWVGFLLVYIVSLRAGLSRRFAILAVLLLAASPWLFYAQSHYSETFQGLLLLGGLLAFREDRFGLAGLLAGAAVWIKPALGIVLAAWVLLTMFRRNRRAALRMAAAGGCMVAGYLLFDWWQTRMLVVSGNGEQDWRFGPSGWIATLLDRRHGLLTFAPWALVAFMLFVVRRSKAEGFRGDVGLPLLFLLALLGSYVALGGDCYGPRYWVPLLPWMAVAGAMFVSAAGRLARLLTAALLLAGLAISVPASLQGSYSWESPPLRPAAFLLEGLPGWAGRLARSAIHRAG
jgi:hypothetical protein